MEYYLGINRNTGWIHATMWRNLKNIMLMEKPDTGGQMLYDFIYEMFTISKSTETK